MDRFCKLGVVTQIRLDSLAVGGGRNNPNLYPQLVKKLLLRYQSSVISWLGITPQNKSAYCLIWRLEPVRTLTFPDSIKGRL